MAYIGNSPVIGNFQVCDAISVVNGQAAYTMQVDSANVTPESANHMLVSLNGILQKPGSSFTISGSTITFASNLATGDVIDFIMLLGNVLDIGTPSDATVTNAKTNFVSTSSAAGLQIKGDGTTDGTLQLNCSQNSHGVKLRSPSHSSGQSYTLTLPTGNVTAEKFLKVASVSGSGTTGVGQLSFADAGGGMWEFISSTNITSSTAQVDFTTLSTDFIDFCFVITDLHPATDSVELHSRVFTGTGGSQAIVDSASYHFVNVVHDNQVDQDNGTGQDKIELSKFLGADSNEASSFEVVLFNPHSTTFDKVLKLHGVAAQQDSGRTGVTNSGGKFASTTAVTGFRFFMSSGNIDNGRFSLYGRKHS
jgi:hypothetical protein